MAIVRRKAAHELELGEIHKRLAELRLELAKERAATAIGAVPKNPSRIRELRRAIARLLTELRLRGGEPTGRSM